MNILEQYNGFIAYRLPNKGLHRVCYIDTIHKRNDKSDISDYEFIFAPFNKNDQPTYLLKFSIVETDGVLPDVELQTGDLNDISKDNYIKSCQDLIDRISEEDISKVILSRTHSILDSDIDLNKLFHSMCIAYPDAFVYVLHHPEIGTWAAATPELLIARKDDTFRTVALAGTRKYNAENSQHWGNKEVEEHKYIETYVHDSLMLLGLDYMKSNVRTRRAGNVEHIISLYEIKESESRLEELIETLHPGPAISGYPPSKAVDIISEIESHNRLYYCGYLGPIDIGFQSNLYINLRCMEIFSNGYKIYVGGGITKDSIAENEWTETILKSKTLSNIIRPLGYEDHQ